MNINYWKKRCIFIAYEHDRSFMLLNMVMLVTIEKIKCSVTATIATHCCTKPPPIWYSIIIFINKLCVVLFNFGKYCM